MKELYLTIERPTVATLYDMEKYGITVEKDALKEYGDQLVGRIEELEKNIYEQAGKTFNINSPKQLGVILFEDLKMPFAKKTKTGYSTSADILEKLAPDYPMFLTILEYRQLTKLKVYLCGWSGSLYSGGWKDSQYFPSESNGKREDYQVLIQTYRISRFVCHLAGRFEKYLCQIQVMYLSVQITLRLSFVCLHIWQETHI